MAQLKIMIYQLSVVLIASSITWVLYPNQLTDVAAVLFGGFVSISATAWLALRLEQATRKLEKGIKKGAVYLYLGAIEKFVLAILLLGWGIVIMKMHPLPVIIGLISGQIGFAIGSYKLNNLKR
jgi:hypothetical protein